MNNGVYRFGVNIFRQAWTSQAFFGSRWNPWYHCAWIISHQLAWVIRQSSRFTVNKSYHVSRRVNVSLFLDWTRKSLFAQIPTNATRGNVQSLTSGLDNHLTALTWSMPTWAEKDRRSFPRMAGYFYIKSKAGGSGCQNIKNIKVNTNSDICIQMKGEQVSRYK